MSGRTIEPQAQQGGAPPAPADMLSQLRDIHAGPELPWWPPAPGWWLLALLALALLVFLARRLARRLARQRRRKACLAYLDSLADRGAREGDPSAFLASVNPLLKRVALEAFPDESVARLQGEAWARFLSDHAGSGQAGPWMALAEGPYRRTAEFDLPALHGAARQFIERHG